MWCFKAQQEQKRQDNKEMAAFNLGVAETLRAKKSAKSSQFEVGLSNVNTLTHLACYHYGAFPLF